MKTFSLKITLLILHSFYRYMLCPIFCWFLISTPPINRAALTCICKILLLYQNGHLHTWALYRTRHYQSVLGKILAVGSEEAKAVTSPFKILSEYPYKVWVINSRHLKVYAFMWKYKMAKRLTLKPQFSTGGLRCHVHWVAMCLQSSS